MTSSTKLKPAAPRIALTPAEAAESLGCSLNHFKTYIAPDLPWARTGRKKFVAVSELQRWVDENSRTTL